MYKLKIVILFIFILKGNIQAQKNYLCGDIQYEHFKNFDFEYIENYRMLFNEKESFSEEVKINKTTTVNKKIKNKEGISRANIIGRNNLEPQYFYNNKDNFYFRENFSDNILIVKENIFLWNWKIHNEKKKIGNFTCSKASIHFRGREYITWFTKEIPVPYGPWKFKGLPGLILEVYDVDNVFHITTKKISINTNTSSCNIKIDQNELIKALTIKEYIKKKEKIIDGIFLQLSSKLPKGTKPLKRSKKNNTKKIEIFNL